eukprot:jgi/Mesvir1/6476/Mv19550-RA.1
MFGLYGDLPPPSKAVAENGDAVAAAKGSESDAGVDAAKPSSWYINKLMPSRKPGAAMPPPQLLRQRDGPSAPVLASGVVKARLSAGTAEGRAAPADASARGESDALPARPSWGDQPALVGAAAAVQNEYDPARPNDYEEFCAAREKRRREAEIEEARNAARRLDDERRRKEEEARELERQAEREREDKEATGGGDGSQADARSLLHISGEEAWKRRAMMGRGGGAPPPEEAGAEGARPGLGSGGAGLGADKGAGGGAMSAAERMMAKMGWKEGQGLGKSRQGMTTPLVARKSDRRSGVIVNAEERPLRQPAQPPAPPQQPAIVGSGSGPAGAITPGGGKRAKPGGVSFNMPPTRVVLLKNMVGPGEVDDELEGEVASECEKYGMVLRVLIFEVTDPDFPPTEAVRIFIEFERQESATKAVVDLDGRFFGGRVVKAGFFDEDMFTAHRLAPEPDDP